jgi:hypothetical protein
MSEKCPQSGPRQSRLGRRLVASIAMGTTVYLVGLTGLVCARYRRRVNFFGFVSAIVMEHLLSVLDWLGADLGGPPQGWLALLPLLPWIEWVAISFVVLTVSSKLSERNRRPGQFSLRALLLGVALVALILGLLTLAWRCYLRSLEPKLDAVFGNDRVRAVIAEPEAVEVYRLGPLPPSINWEEAEIKDYPVNGGPIALDTKTAHDLSMLLTDSRSYVFGAGPISAVYVPHVRARFSRGSSEVWIDFDLDCARLTIHQNGHAVGGGVFGYVERDVVQIMKRLFPRDREIQNKSPP